MMRGCMEKFRWQQSVFCLISELWKARWIRNEGHLDLEDMTEIVYRYSRELEHSDENLELFDMMMEKTKIFV